MKVESGNNGSIIKFKGYEPKIHPSCFICEGVRIIGNVEIGEETSIWYNTVIRGDVHYIRIGSNCNIQDISMLHVTHDTHPLNMGDRVSIGHSVSLHGCTIKDRALVGIGARVLDGAVIGESALVAAGAIVREGFEVPPHSLAAGVPARIIRELRPEEIDRVESTSYNYAGYVRDYRNMLNNSNGVEL
jgi:carbonic anhydrase/acetyltransferase-like protein (isoleucine patch superfamily)